MQINLNDTGRRGRGEAWEAQPREGPSQAGRLPPLLRGLSWTRVASPGPSSGRTRCSLGGTLPSPTEEWPALEVLWQREARGLRPAESLSASGTPLLFVPQLPWGQGGRGPAHASRPVSFTGGQGPGCVRPAVPAPHRDPACGRMNEGDSDVHGKEAAAVARPPPVKAS